MKLRPRRLKGREWLFILGFVAIGTQMVIAVVQGPKAVSPEVLTAGTAVLLTPWIAGADDKRRGDE